MKIGCDVLEINGIDHKMIFLNLSCNAKSCDTVVFQKVHCWWGACCVFAQP